MASVGGNEYGVRRLVAYSYCEINAILSIDHILGSTTG